MFGEHLRRNGRSRRVLQSLTMFGVLASIMGCITIPLPGPIGSDSSLIFLSMNRYLITPFGYQERILGQSTEVNLKRIGPHGKVEKIPYTFETGGYYLFTNVYPGEYQIVGIVDAYDPVTSGIQMQAGRSLYVTHPGRRYEYPFPESLSKESTVEVRAGSVVFMGDFVVNLKPRDHVDKIVLKRTPIEEKSALDFLKRKYPDSPWVKYVK